MCIVSIFCFIFNVLFYYNYCVICSCFVMILILDSKFMWYTTSTCVSDLFSILSFSLSLYRRWLMRYSWLYYHSINIVLCLILLEMMVDHVLAVGNWDKDQGHSSFILVIHSDTHSCTKLWDHSLPCMYKINYTGWTSITPPTLLYQHCLHYSVNYNNNHCKKNSYMTWFEKPGNWQVQNTTTEVVQS